jgi:hypothetical protein
MQGLIMKHTSELVAKNYLRDLHRLGHRLGPIPATLAPQRQNSAPVDIENAILPVSTLDNFCQRCYCIY